MRRFAKKDGNLSVQQVIDIHSKFPDIDKAKSVAKKLSTISNRHKKRKMHAAIRESAPSDDIPTIEKRAERMLHEKEYKIHLLGEYTLTIEKVAYGRRITEEDLLVDIIERWVREYNGGKER